jgi:hypothetical protein
MRNAGGILELVNALFVAFERPNDPCFQIHGVAFCLGAGDEDLTSQLLFGGVQLVVKGPALVVERADIHPLRLLLLEDRADCLGDAGEQFAATLPCFLEGFLAVPQDGDIPPQQFHILPQCLLSGFQPFNLNPGVEGLR